jgi:hypothetical protein
MYRFLNVVKMAGGTGARKRCVRIACRTTLNPAGQLRLHLRLWPEASPETRSDFYAGYRVSRATLYRALAG